MIDSLLSFLSYSFVWRALAVGLLITVCSALLGASLVLKRYSMMGDGLSHVGFGASAIGLALGIAPLAVAVPAVLLAAFLLLKLGNRGKMKGDAAIAVVSCSALAVGVIAAKLSHGMNVDINNYMFGSIYTLGENDVAVSVALCAVVLALYLLFYNRIFSVTFDESFARATGVRVSAYDTLLACLTAVTVVIGMRMMGALLISGLLVFPVLTAGRLCRSYRSVIICSVCVAVAGFLGGIALSFALNTPPGASVITVNLVLLCLFRSIEWAVSTLFGKR